MVSQEKLEQKRLKELDKLRKLKIQEKKRLKKKVN